MYITINNRKIEVVPGETLIEAARRMGCAIPSLCYAKGAKHRSSCMVCAVKNAANGQIIPSCSTYPTEGMRIETETEEVQTVRALSLELLLSDHRADCEAPCSLVCPQGWDIEKMLMYYDSKQYADAFNLLKGEVNELKDAFNLLKIPCDTCKAPCEKACRRGSVDTPVSIRSIIREVAGMFANQSPAADKSVPKQQPDKNLFYSRLGRFSEKEKERLRQTVTTPSRCLHCACAGREGCRLRLHATEARIKRARYDASSALPAMHKEHVAGRLWFEAAKCIRCGLCVYNSANGFTFKDRGFGMQVVIPEENKPHVDERLAKLCPTGALYLVNNE